MINVKELDFDNRISDMLAEENKQKYKEACKNNKYYKSITLKEYVGCTRSNIDICEYIKCKYGKEFCNDKELYMYKKTSDEQYISLVMTIIVLLITVAIMIIFKDEIIRVITGVMKHLGLGEPWRSNIHRDNIGGLMLWEI